MRIMYNGDFFGGILMRKRNGMIDFMRFVFCILIVLEHSELFRGRMLAGYIGVEFFFIVSGWLLMQHIEQKFLGGEPDFLWEVWHKIKGFYPEFFVATITAAVLLKYFEVATDGRMHLLGTFNDLLILQTFGFYVAANTGTMWYLTAMLGAYILLLYFIYKFKDEFLYVFAPLAILIIYGGFAQKYHTVAVITQITLDGFLWCGMLRGFAGMALGALLYRGSLYLRCVAWTPLGKKFLTFLELAGYCVVIYVAVLIKTFSYWDFFMIVFIALSVMISFSQLTLTSKFFQGKNYNLLGRLSLNIFLNHAFWGFIIAKCIPEYSTPTKMMCYFGGTIICTIFNYYLANLLRKNFYIVKNLLVESKY